MHIKNFLFVLSPALIFLFIAISTLSHYGIIWDEPDHFYRGQAYLNYYLTGNSTYDNLKNARRSYYQDDKYNAEYYLANDGGHPPLNGIFAALSNYIFYQKLGWLGDVESLHLFGVITSSVLVFVVAIFAYQTYGILASLVSSISVASYPLFWSESHFNIKDPSEAAFFGLTIWAFWMSLKNYKWYWLLLSVFSFAAALGTKFNILFLPFIIVPYLIVRYQWKFSLKQVSGFMNIPLSFRLVFLLSPLIIMSIFIISWPYLWQDLGGLFKVVGFYLERGLSGQEEAGIFLPGEINIYPLVWIIITTAPWVLFLCILGFYSTRKDRRPDKVCLLWLLWLVVPVIRVMLPHARTYGGVRQLMEYIPAMALLAVVGAAKLKEMVDRKIFIPVVVLAIFIPHIFVLVRFHPNENVYFNFLVGGIKGASERNIPYWGNSFGNAYLQGIWWLNQNAEESAKLALLQKVNTNISPVFLRKDIQHHAGVYRSGIYKDGEYIMELTHQGSMHYYFYVWEYINKFLEPVHEVEVDGVSIAKVWKNDSEHTKPEMRNYKEVVFIPSISIDKENRTILASMTDEVLLSRIDINDNSLNSCNALMGEVWTSVDGNWTREKEFLHSDQLPAKYTKPGITSFYFAARRAKSVKLVLDISSACILNDPVVKFIIFQKPGLYSPDQ